jgi:hypothetical protein
MRAHLQGTAAIDLSTITAAQAAGIRSELTLVQTGYSNGDKPIKFWMDYGDGWLHVPRGWFLANAEHRLTAFGAGLSVVDGRSDGRPLPDGTRPHVTFGASPFPSGQPQAIADAVNTARTNGHGGLFLAPTRSGKSLMSLEVACRLGGSTLVLVNDVDLLRQFHRDVTEHLNSTCGIIRGKDFNYSEPFTVATVQTLSKRILEPEVRNAWRTILIDECNMAPCDTIWNVLSRLNARYIFGLTATPDRRDGLHDAIRWIVGPPAASLTRKLEADVHWLSLPWTYDGSIKRGKYTDIIKSEKAVAGDISRVNRLADEAVGAVKAGRRVLMMVHMLDHARSLADAVAQRGVVPGVFVGGSSDAEMQRKVVIATYKKAAKGIDFKPPPTCFIPAGPIRDIRQAVGRALQPQVPHRTLILHPVDRCPELIKWARSCAEYYTQCGFTFRNPMPSRWAA